VLLDVERSTAATSAEGVRLVVAFRTESALNLLAKKGKENPTYVYRKSSFPSLFDCVSHIYVY
jgi:hypothetical protein